MDSSHFNFHCPSCGQKVNQNGDVVLTTTRNTGEQGTIFLNSSIGSYKYRHEPDIRFEKGEIVQFSCPHCAFLLSSPHYKNFASLKMRTPNEIEFEVLFSMQAGKQKTYLITEDGVESYGADSPEEE